MNLYDYLKNHVCEPQTSDEGFKEETRLHSIIREVYTEVLAACGKEQPSPQLILSLVKNDLLREKLIGLYKKAADIVFNIDEDVNTCNLFLHSAMIKFVNSIVSGTVDFYNFRLIEVILFNVTVTGLIKRQTNNPNHIILSRDTTLPRVPLKDVFMNENQDAKLNLSQYSKETNLLSITVSTILNDFVYSLVLEESLDLDFKIVKLSTSTLNKISFLFEKINELNFKSTMKKTCVSDTMSIILTISMLMIMDMLTEE